MPKLFQSSQTTLQLWDKPTSKPAQSLFNETEQKGCRLQPNDDTTKPSTDGTLSHLGYCWGPPLVHIGKIIYIFFNVPCFHLITASMGSFITAAVNLCHFKVLKCKIFTSEKLKLDMFILFVGSKMVNSFRSGPANISTTVLMTSCPCITIKIPQIPQIPPHN